MDPQRQVGRSDQPTYSKGAGYGMDANLFGGGYKHLDIEAFIEVVQTQEWKERAKVQLWVKAPKKVWANSRLRSSGCGGVRATQSPLRSHLVRPERSPEPRRGDGCERSIDNMAKSRTSHVVPDPAWATPAATWREVMKGTLCFSKYRLGEPA